MGESTHNIEDQLDALLNQADAASEADAPAGTGAPAKPDDDEGGAGDVVGGAFADEVQQMLDEAAAELDEADAHDADAAEPQTEQEDEAAGHEALIGQIDSMLAEAADEAIGGDFESVEALGLGDEVDLPPDPTELAAAELSPSLDTEPDAEPEAPTGAEAPGDEPADAVAGAFESIDDLATDTQPAPREAAPAGPNAPGAAPLTPGAAAVAAELDADERAAAAPRKAAGATKPGRDEQALPDAPPIDLPPARGPGWRERLLSLMARVNRPLDGCSPTTRNLVGRSG